MDTIKERIIEGNQDKELKKIANYEGNHTLLLLKRIQDPLVKEKLVNDLYEEVSTPGFNSLTTELLLLIQEESPTIVKNYLKENLDEQIERVFSVTNIEYSDIGYMASSHSGLGGGTVGVMCKDQIGGKHGIHHTTLLQSISEAHEKGHLIRDYSEKSNLGKRILEPFDFSKVTFSPEEISTLKYFFNLNSSPEYQTNDEKMLLEKHVNYNSDVNEIIERMSQLKNYFGMSGTEKFTKHHLRYAKQHYIEDTGIFALQIKTFFDAISDEDKFIDLMNTLGI